MEKWKTFPPMLNYEIFPYSPESNYYIEACPDRAPTEKWKTFPFPMLNYEIFPSSPASLTTSEIGYCYCISYAYTQEATSILSTWYQGFLILPPPPLPFFLPILDLTLPMQMRYFRPKPKDARVSAILNIFAILAKLATSAQRFLKTI